MKPLRRLLLALCCLAAPILGAAGLPSGVPASAPAPVLDLAGMLSAPLQQQLNALLREQWRAGRLQLAVLTLPSLEGRAIEDVGITVARQWALGGAETDNGVLLLIAKQDRALRIEVGQKLEGVLTDVACKRIIEDVMVPRLRAGQADEAVQAGVAAILARVDAPVAEEEPRGDFAPGAGRGSPAPAAAGFPWILFALLSGGFVIWSLLHLGEARASAQRNGFGTAPPLWIYVAGYCLLTFLWLLLRMAASGKGGGRSGSSSGGYGGGGGGYSGGGASGKW